MLHRKHRLLLATKCLHRQVDVRQSSPGRTQQPSFSVPCRPQRSKRPRVSCTYYPDHGETSRVRYDEYYHGDVLLDQRDVAVQDMSWAELSKIKEFEQEDPSTFNAYMKELVTLVPDLGGRLRCLRLEVLQGIWRDEAIPCKLVELKLQFLEVDVSRLVARRPSILIDKNFEAVPEATAYLQQFVNPKELNHLVEAQPWFLAAHLDQYLAGYSTVLDVGPREALRGILLDPGGIGFDYCYSCTGRQ